MNGFLPPHTPGVTVQGPKKAPTAMQRGASDDSRDDTIVDVATHELSAHNPRLGGGAPSEISSVQKKRKKRKKTTTTTTTKKKKINEMEDVVKEAGRTSKDALSLVLLKQGHDELNLMGNFGSDCFNSLIDEATGLLTMLTVYRPFDKKLFHAAAGVYGFNVLVRFGIGMNVLLRPPTGSRLARDTESERIFCGTWLRVAAGTILIMLEPVSGIRLLNSAFEPEPALTKDKQTELEKAKQGAINVESVTKAMIEETTQKMKEQPFVAAGDEKGQAKAKLVKLERAMVEKEVAHLKRVAPVTHAESDFKLGEAAVEVLKRKFELERARLKGTETVELQMAIFEDIPEIAVAMVFVAMDGLANATNSDVSLFVTSLVVSLFHALKCFWSFWKLRKTIEAAKLADKGKLKTHENYFASPEIKADEQRAAEKVRIGERRTKVDEQSKALIKTRSEFDRKQLEFDVAWGQTKISPSESDLALRAARKMLIGEPTYRKKLVIVGDFVGKTCLLIRWSEGRFPKEFVYTEENYVGDSAYEDKRKTQSRVELSLWDTSSDGNYDRLRPLSYPDTDVVLICYSIDSPDSLENVCEKVGRPHSCCVHCDHDIVRLCALRFSLHVHCIQTIATLHRLILILPFISYYRQWVPEVRHFCPGVRFILVGLKTDLRGDTSTRLEVNNAPPYTL